MLSPATYSRYSRLLKTLRARGDRPGFLEMGLAADLVLAQERGEDEEVERIRGKLELSGEEITP